MIASQSKQASKVTRKYPFLKNFPFGEFSMDVADSPGPGFMLDEDFEPIFNSESEPSLVKFNYVAKGTGKISIVIFEQELNWIDSISSDVKDLDKIRRSLDRGLRSKDLLAKRDAVELADAWCANVQDKRAKLSYSTMGEVLAGLIKDQSQLIRIISKLSLLSLKRGLVSLTKEEYQIVLTYYHFQLIYTKLILGLVIASKISI